MTDSLYPAPDRVELRGGDGPPQPVWLNIQTYSTEWYRRYRAWHLVRYPKSDAVTRANLDMLVDLAQERDNYRIEADKCISEYDDLELRYGDAGREIERLRGRARPKPDYSGT